MFAALPPIRRNTSWTESHAVIVQHANGKRYYSWALNLRDARADAMKSIRRHGPAEWAKVFHPDRLGIARQSDWDNVSEELNPSAMVYNLAWDIALSELA